MSKKRKTKPSGKPTEPLAVRLPTPRQIGKLPRWATVAFAARCARRVQPLFHTGQPDPSEYLRVLDSAISVIEEACASITHADVFDKGYIETHASTLRGARAVYAVGANSHVSLAVDAALCAASEAVDASPPGPRDYRAVDRSIAAKRVVHHTAKAADAADAAATGFGYVDTDVAIRRDFDLLKAAAKADGWTDDTPLPPEFFGPLWPEGAPDGWPAVEEDSAESELVIEIDVSEDPTDEDVSKVVEALVTDLDGLHRAYGGRGLKIADLEIFQDAPVREEVLQ